MRLPFFVFFSLSFCFFSWAQSSEKEDFALHKELSAGINLNTNGGLLGGLAFRYAIPQNNNFFHIMNLEIVNVKHKKEAQYSSAISSNSFIAEKLNYLFSVRPAYGREYVLFQKHPEAGIRITGVLVGGPTFGITKPYYIEYQYNVNDISVVPYNPIQHNLGQIIGNASFIYGFNELKVRMGMHLKTGLFFELSQDGSSVSGVEFGLHMEAFASSIPIYNIQENKKIYSAVYIILHYGGHR